MFDVATIQVNMNQCIKLVIIAPTTEDGTVTLDTCPRGTLEVHTFRRAKDAAAFMKVSPSTVYRQRREALNND